MRPSRFGEGWVVACTGSRGRSGSGSGRGGGGFPGSAGSVEGDEQASMSPGHRCPQRWWWCGTVWVRRIARATATSCARCVDRRVGQGQVHGELNSSRSRMDSSTPAAVRSTAVVVGQLGGAVAAGGHQPVPVRCAGVGRYSNADARNWRVAGRIRCHSCGSAPRWRRSRGGFVGKPEE